MKSSEARIHASEDTMPESNDDQVHGLPEGFRGVPAPLARAMAQRGFGGLTPVQRAVVDRLARPEDAQRDLRIRSQTGSGKTVALGLALAPHFERQGASPRAISALVIVPTRELVLQGVNELGWLFAELRHVRVAGVMGGASLARERAALARAPQIVVATPGRLLDHIRAGALPTSAIAHVVLDEADRLLDLGFRDELEAIAESLPETRCGHLLSATFPGAVLEIANRFQRDPIDVEGSSAVDAHPDIAHVAHPVRPHERYDALVNLLLLARGSRTLVFVRRRVDAAELAEKLAEDGFAAMPISGDLPQAQRTRTLSAFRRGSIEILVATDVAARGIDVPEIGAVIHLDTPFDAETYVHRSGRTGRAGRPGRSVLLVGGREERRIRQLLSGAGIELRWQPAPGPDQVRKAERKALRRALWARLETCAEGAEAVGLQYAASLLEGRDAAHVVAALLELASPELPCAPRELSAPDAAPAARREKRKREFVPFSISWGSRKGATVPRVLSQVCRRGGVRGKDVGSIRIEAGRSTFQIAVEEAERFQASAERPDERDPGIVIERLSDPRGSAPKGGGARRGKPRATTAKGRGGARQPRPRPARSSRS